MNGDAAPGTIVAALKRSTKLKQIANRWRWQTPTLSAEVIIGPVAAIIAQPEGIIAQLEVIIMAWLVVPASAIFSLITLMQAPVTDARV